MAVLYTVELVVLNFGQFNNHFEGFNLGRPVILTERR